MYYTISLALTLENIITGWISDVSILRFLFFKILNEMFNEILHICLCTFVTKNVLSWTVIEGAMW